MSFPRTTETAPRPGDQPAVGQAPPPLQSGVLPVNPSQDPGIQPVMPVGGSGEVDVSQVLSPLIDGSFVTAQGQAAVLAGLKARQAQRAGDGATLSGTVPLPGTTPLQGTA